MTPILKAGAVAGAIAAILALAAQYNLKPVVSGELLVVQAQVNDVDRRVTEEQLGSTQMQLYRNLREQRTYLEQKKSVPDILLREQTQLQSKQRRLEKRLEKLQ